MSRQCIARLLDTEYGAGRVVEALRGRRHVQFASELLFNLGSVAVYMALEGVALVDALFWITHPHALHPQKVTTPTKLFALVVYTGVFFFQVWIAERVLVTIFGGAGTAAWGRMMNQLNVAGLRDHCVICGYGQVGRTVVEQLTRAGIPCVLVETDEEALQRAAWGREAGRPRGRETS